MMKNLVAPALAIAIIAGTQTIALGHAVLDTAVPKVCSVVTAPPKLIRIRFTQPIEAAFSHIHVFTRDGKPVDTGPAATDPSDQTQLAAHLTGTLSPGKN